MTTWGRIVAASLVFSAACSGQSGTQPIPTQPTASVSLPVSGAAATFTVRGTVADAAGRPVRDVNLVVVSGPQAGTATMSDDAGRFEFGGLTASVMIRAKKEGYVEQVRGVYTYPGLEPGTAVVWFKLESAVRPPINLAGAYTLTFSADPACTSLPDSLRTRIYRSTLGTTGAWQLMTLTGAAFEDGAAYPGMTDHWNVIALLLFEDYGTLYFQDPPILELLSDGGKLMIEGHAAGTITGASTEFAVTGYIGVVGGASCRSTTHKLVLQRTGP